MYLSYGEQIMNTYLSLRKTADKLGCYNDCSVIALAASTNISYIKAHNIYKSLGRKDNKGSCDSTIFAAFREAKQFLMPINCKAKTVKGFEKELDPKKTYLVFVSGHVLCIKNAKVEDFASKLSRIQKLFEVSDWR